MVTSDCWLLKVGVKFEINGRYEGSSKSFRTFIFSRETVRAGGVAIGRV